MSDLEFEAYVNLLTRFLRLGREQREEIRRELQAHLQDALDEACERGESRAEAIRRVLEDFGDAAELAARFSKLNRKRRWIMHGTLTAACLAFAAVTTSFLFPAAGPATAAPDAMYPVQEARAARTGVGGFNPVADAGEALDEVIYKALSKVIPEVQFQEVPLTEVFAWMQQTLNVNVHVQWQALQDVGLDRDRPISVAVKNLTVERVLQLVLSEAGGTDMRLGFDVQDGILMISTAEILERRMTFEVYDVRDLVSAVTPLRSAAVPPTEPKVATESAGAKPPAATTGPAADLLQLITSSVKPETWEDNGGVSGIRWYNGLLVVRTHAAVHRDIKQLLHSLKSALVESGGTKAAR